MIIDTSGVTTDIKYKYTVFFEKHHAQRNLLYPKLSLFLPLTLLAGYNTN